MAKGMGFILRTVMEEDAVSVVEVLNPIIRAGTFTVMDEIFSVADQLDFIRSFPARGIYHIALDKDSQEAVGIQDVMPISTSNVFKHVGEISTFVALDSQKLGIGTSLSQATFKVAEEKGFLKLRATVRADNLQALAFYQSQGFEIIGIAKKHAWLHGNYVDEVLLEKLLG
jgi:L-amino acid N-acyltransferase YncA